MRRISDQIEEEAELVTAELKRIRIWSEPVGLTCISRRQTIHRYRPNAHLSCLRGSIHSTVHSQRVQVIHDGGDDDGEDLDV